MNTVIKIVTKDGEITAQRKPGAVGPLVDIIGTSPWGDWRARPRSSVRTLLYQLPPDLSLRGKDAIRRLVGKLLAAEEEERNATNAARNRVILNPSSVT